MAKPMIKLSSIKPNPSNPRTVDSTQLSKLKKSIQEFPKMMELRPMVIDAEGYVLGGNMRLKALKELGYKEIPDEWVKRAEELTEDERSRFIIADNVGFGDWDWEMLANEWDSEKLTEWGLEIPEFDTEAEKETDGEDDYERPEVVVTKIKKGDIIEIGQHRLVCGDSTNAETIKSLMGGESYQLVITDPPYGVNYEGKTKAKLKIQNDALTEEETHSLFEEAFRAITPFAKSAASIYVTVPPGLLQLGFMEVLHKAKCLRQCLVWDKGQMVLGHSDYQYQHEPILYGWFPTGKHFFCNDRTKTTVISVKKPIRNELHPTMKPIELFSEFIKNSTVKGDIIIDPFLGSGSTMLSAHQNNRKCYGVEIDPKYCQVIIDRLVNYDPSLIVKINGIVQ